MRFLEESQIAAPAARVFAFHEESDAFARLQPPWQRVRILQPPSSLAVGTRVVLQVRIGIFWQTIEAEHVEYEPGKSFTDRMVRGPFRSWVHRHRVESEGEDACRLIDDIEYELPFGWLGRVLLAWKVRRDLERLFEFRHRVTREACETSEVRA